MNQACANEWSAIRDTIARFGTDVRAAIESCSGAADLVEELVTRGGWHVDLAHPGYVARMKGSPDKTEFSNARMLADLERVGYLPKVWHDPTEVREPRRLVRCRQQFVGERRNVKLRIGAFPRDNRVAEPVGANPWEGDPERTQGPRCDGKPVLVLGDRPGGCSAVVRVAITRAEPSHLGYGHGPNARIEDLARRGETGYRALNGLTTDRCSSKD